MDEKILKEVLINTVIQYGKKWNTIEDSIYKEHKEEEKELREKYSDNEFHYAKRTNWFEKFSNLTNPMFDEYCTDKKRVYGGKNIRSFGFPVKFHGIENPTETDVILKNKNRAEVYIKTNTDFSDEYLFIVLRKLDTWKIDSYKNKCYGKEKWESGVL